MACFTRRSNHKLAGKVEKHQEQNQQQQQQDGAQCSPYNSVYSSVFVFNICLHSILLIARTVSVVHSFLGQWQSFLYAISIFFLSLSDFFFISIINKLTLYNNILKVAIGLNQSIDALDYSVAKKKTE